MTKNESLLRALNDVDEAMLSDALTYRAPAVHRLPRWLPAVAAILVLTVCTAAALTWDSRFLDLLSPTEAIMEKYDSMLDPVQVTEVYDDLTLTVTQTLGDAYDLYIAVDVTFAPHVNLPEDGTQLIFQHVDFYQFREDGSRRNIYGGRMIESAPLDLETRTVQFLIRLDSTNGQLLDSPITMEIDGITGEGFLLKNEPQTITWQAGNVGAFYEWTLLSDDEPVGKVRLSALSLSAMVTKEQVRRYADLPKYTDFDTVYQALRQSIHIVMNDGSEFPLNTFGGGGGGYAVDMRLNFRAFLDLDQVAYLEVAGYRLELD